MKMVVSRLMLVLAASVLVVTPLHAQQRAALRAGVVAQPIHAPIDSTDGGGKGKRILVGVGVGAVVGGIVGGLSARNGEKTGSPIDAIAAGASVAAGALLGALLGGLIGALVH